MIFCIKYRKTLCGKGKRQKLNIVLFAVAMKRKVLKNVDISKITSMQCSWVRRWFKNDFHDKKVMPLFLIGKTLNFIGLLFNDNGNIKP